MSLYDYFGVANPQELYDLITNDDPRVDDLQNFLTYAKQEISYESPKVFNYEALFKLVNSEQLIPRENEAYIIGFSTQRSPTYYAKISGDMSEKEVLNIAFKADIKSYAIVDHPNIFSQDQDGVIRDIDCNIGLIRGVYGNTARDCLDRISIYGEEGILPLRMYSHEAEKYEPVDFMGYDHTADYKEFIIGNDSIYDLPEELTAASELSDFVGYYVAKELEGLNVYYDEQKVESLLCMKATLNKQEIFTVITYDDQLNINGVKDMFMGTYNNTAVDLAFIMDQVNKDQNKGFIVSHNHPSGGLRASKADIETTRALGRLGELFEKRLYDHYIASSRGVTSLAQEGTIGRSPGVSFLAMAKEREVDKYLLKLADSLEKQSAKLQDSPKKKQGRSI